MPPVETTTQNPEVEVEAVKAFTTNAGVRVAVGRKLTLKNPELLARIAAGEVKRVKPVTTEEAEVERLKTKGARDSAANRDTRDRRNFEEGQLGQTEKTARVKAMKNFFSDNRTDVSVGDTIELSEPELSRRENAKEVTRDLSWKNTTPPAPGAPEPSATPEGRQ